MVGGVSNGSTCKIALSFKEQLCIYYLCSVVTAFETFKYNGQYSLVNYYRRGILYTLIHWQKKLVKVLFKNLGNFATTHTIIALKLDKNFIQF